MSAFENPHASWHRSSLCDGGGCVEVAVADGARTDSEKGSDPVYLMRNSTDPAGQILRFTSEQWAQFIAHIKEGTGL